MYAYFHYITTIPLIEGIVLEADYSAALTLLLRYPAPSPPHGPRSFVSDALYLRDNLLLDGGDHIISKYSRRAPETTVTRKLPKKIKRARTADQEAAQVVAPPRTTPARIFQDQGGIEGIIHEAAKGVYSQGEKWGVGKALRGAMQGLQSGHSSPRRISGRSQGSVDDGTPISNSLSDMMAKLNALEQRNRSLASLLGHAVEELWTQQNKIYQEKKEEAGEGLSLAIAKVQFVQVYLENSTMPLPSNASPVGETIDDEASRGAEKDKMSLEAATIPKSSAHHDLPAGEEGLDNTLDKEPLTITQDPSATHEKVPPSTPERGNQSKPSSPPHRPSLDKSPFSWMLGEDERKSQFVAPSPIPKETLRNTSGNLFGDTGRKARAGGRSKPSAGIGSQDKTDVFGN